jgi:bifunctional DNA-binding transcriptional regulator/antitoxin component of YhaV-PrlF toxin-antitoxin module
MSIVTIKKKYQVVIPQRGRQQIRVRVGDLLEAQAYKGKIVFTPKSMVDRALAEGLDDLKKGRVQRALRQCRRNAGRSQRQGSEIRQEN